MSAAFGQFSLGIPRVSPKLAPHAPAAVGTVGRLQEAAFRMTRDSDAFTEVLSAGLVT